MVFIFISILTFRLEDTVSEEHATWWTMGIFSESDTKNSIICLLGFLGVVDLLLQY